nr:MAG TPA: hypothetical protein [Caudoviricetes sp.]
MYGFDLRKQISFIFFLLSCRAVIKLTALLYSE